MAILLLATGLRLAALDVTPPGLHYDEAFKAINARDIVRTGQLHIFFPGNFGEEPLHATAGALVFALAGPRVWGIRLTSAFFGILTAAALYFSAQVLFKRAARDRRRAGVFAALMGATLYWGLNFSRIGIEPITLVLLITLHFGTLWWALDTRPEDRAAPARFVAAGFFAGAVYYTYLAARVTPVALALFGGYLFLFQRERLRAHRRGLALAAVVGGLVLAPLALYFAQNPALFFLRAGQVLTPEGLLANLGSTLGMLFVAGDMDPRDNLPGRPALDWSLGLFFLIGLFVSARRARREPPFFLLLAWLGVFTVPAVVTEFAPNFRRAIGALPAVVLICAVGTEWLAQRAEEWAERRDRAKGKIPARVLVSGVLTAVLLASGAVSAWDYFEVWAQGSGLFYSFDQGLLEVGQALASRPAGEQLCLSPSYPDHPTMLWAMDGRAYSTFDGRRVAVLPDSSLPATCGIITFEDQQFSPARILRGAEPLLAIADLERKPYAQLYRIPPGAATVEMPSHPLAAQVGDFARIEGYDLAEREREIEVTVYWRAVRVTTVDYTVFTHLIGPSNPASGSTVWAGEDGQPGKGSYPTSRWRPGQTIVERYRLKVPENAPGGQYQVELGMYLLTTGARLPVTLEGKRAPEERLLLDVNR